MSNIADQLAQIKNSINEAEKELWLLQIRIQIIYLLNIVKEGQLMKRWGDDNSVDIHDGGVVNGGITSGGDDKREACKFNPFFLFKI